MSLLILAQGLQAQVEVAHLTATDKGVQIESSAGTFTLVPGNLRMAEDDFPGAKPALSMEGTDTVVAAYPGGAELRMVVSGGEIDCVLTGTPPEAYAYLLSMSIPTTFSAGGQLSFGKLPLQPFPQDGGKELVSQAVATQFNLVGPTGEGFTLRTTKGYAQVLDNKSSFNYLYYFRMGEHPGEDRFQFRFEPLDASVVP